MVDFLQNIDTERGPVEPMPVTLVSSALEVPLDSRLAALDRKSAVAAFTTVASGIASVPILAANAARKGAFVINTDANILYLDLTGGAASATRHAAALATGASFAVPNNFTGAITGIWAADGVGSALVTELT